MSMQSLQVLYDRSNITGPLTSKYLTNGGLTNLAINQALRYRHATGASALANRIVVNGCLSGSTRLSFARATAPLQIMQVALLRKPVLGLFPAGELLLGRGTTPTARLEDSTTRSQKIDALWQMATEHGLAGQLLERLPMRLAATAEVRGHLKLAQACLAGAVMGRCALQVPRAALALWTASETILIVAVATAISLGLEAGARTAQVAVRALQAKYPSLPLTAARRELDFVVQYLSRQLFYVVAQTTRQDDLGQVAAAPGPISNRLVAEKTNTAMGRFLLIDPVLAETDGGRQVRETADSIVADLRRYCAGAPDNTALRGGLALLRDMMQITYEEAQWPLPAELR